jgi:mRNA interferase MazF
MSVEQGTILLIPIPFTDLTSSKRRPVIVVSHDTYNASGFDMIVVAMTSNPVPTPYSFTLTNADLRAGQLNRPGKVRVDKIYTIAQQLAVRTFGIVKRETVERIITLLNTVINIEV